MICRSTKRYTRVVFRKDIIYYIAILFYIFEIKNAAIFRSTEVYKE